MQSCLVETVALSDDNQNWVREEIRRAIHPNGWKNAANWLRYWSVVAVVPTVMVGLLALAFAAGYYAFSRVGQEATFQTRTTDKLSTIDDSLKALNIVVAEIRLKLLSSNPADPRSIKEAQNVLDAVKASKVELSKDAIEEAGKRFIDAANTTPEAWNAALNFLNYRSSLNVYVRTFKAVNVPAGARTNFDIGPAIAGKPIPTLMHVAVGVAPKDAARFEQIGQNLNQQLQFGSAQLVLTGGAVTLDNKYVRHAIFEGVEIHYTGKALVLEDALFINCTFVLENTQSGRQLGQVLLASSPVTFEKAS
jgi:hypothetical protein